MATGEDNMARCSRNGSDRRGTLIHGITSDYMKNLLSKLLAVQKALKPIVKDDVNPHFKNKYFDINSLLAVVKPILSEHGLVLIQPLDGNALRTILYDADGESISSVVNLPDIQDPQKLGSAISYMRRYSLVSLLAIEGDEDDDGNTASRQTSPVAPQSSVAPKAVQSTSDDVCKDCGAKRVTNPNTGKVFCEKKCWLQPKAELPVIQQEGMENVADLSQIPF